ncbi:MAG: hypothetical protein ABI601_07070 [bacterium]
MDEHAFLVRTDQFESITPQPFFINPRCFGADFSHWLSAALRARGITVGGAIAEDWGWLLPVTHEDRPYHISIGIMDSSIGMQPAEWRLGVAPVTGLASLRQRTRGPSSLALDGLTAAVEATLGSEPRFTSVVRE